MFFGYHRTYNVTLELQLLALILYIVHNYRCPFAMQ